MAAYEYTNYVWEYSPRMRELRGVELRGPEDAARLTLWQSDQYVILPDVWKWLDEGWEPVTEVGPAGYDLRSYKSYRNYGVREWIMMLVFIVGSAGAGLLLLPFLRREFVEPIEFRVKLRRRVDA